LINSKETEAAVSKSNVGEAELTVSLVKALLAKAGKSLASFGGEIGVVTPYKAQVTALKEMFVKKLEKNKEKLKESIQISSVDSFQGSEKDIMIFNAVRSNNHENLLQSLGFCADERRLNVAITRPRHFMFIIGNSGTLAYNDMWHRLIDHHKMRPGCYYRLPKHAYSEQKLCSMLCAPQTEADRSGVVP